jgi:hypothetical protein
MNKIKILLVYIVYPMALATYFKKALQHREDVDLKVAGPYTANWTPWMGGMTVPMKYAVAPDIALPFPPNIGEINYEIIKAQLGEWVPDIVLNIDAGLHFKYKPTDGMVVTVGTDPHVLNDLGLYDAPRKYSDKFFSMQQCYAKEGDIYLPYAYSQYDHFPDDSVSKDTDACLIGLQYEHRQTWINELRRRGVSVIAENGPIFDEARALYNRSRIGLNWSTLDDLNARAFEIPAMKLYPVMNSVSDLRSFECLNNVQPFYSLDEAISFTMWAKENPTDAANLAESSYQKVQGQHYDARVQQILTECGFA